MKIAHEKEFDWVWLLDQDGTTEKGCLASLLRNAGQADILCPQIVNIDNPEMVLPQSGAVQNFGVEWYGLHSLKVATSLFATHGAPLISKLVIDRIGYYDPHNFLLVLRTAIMRFGQLLNTWLSALWLKPKLAIQMLAIGV